MTRFIIRDIGETFAVIDTWSGQAVSFHHMWPAATKAALTLERNHVEWIEDHRD